MQKRGKNMKKKLIALFMAVCLLATILPMSALADNTVTVNVVGTQEYSMAYQMFESINAEREKATKNQLTFNQTLTTYAMQRAAELALDFGHTRPNGDAWSTIVDKTAYGNYSYIGENAAGGTAQYMDVTAAMNGFMNSEGHRENILRDAFTQVGVGCFRSNGTLFWIQIFGNSTSNTTQASQGSAAQAQVAVSTLASKVNTSITLSSNSINLNIGENKQFFLKNTNSNNQGSYIFPIVSNEVKDINDNSRTIAQVQTNSEGRMTVTAKESGTGVISINAFNGQSNPVTINLTVTGGSDKPTTDKTPVTITGVSAATGLVYNGSAQKGYAGTPTSSNYSGSYTVKYEGIDGTSYSSSAAPTNAGSYRVTISVPESDETYTGSISLDFTIGKASITIKADDKQAAIGAAQPSYTYTVTGLAANDALKTQPTLSCTPDMSKAGIYDIVPSGAVVPDGGNYNSTITYVKGKLTVSDKLTALLKSLSWSAGTMNKGFDPNTTEYVLNLSYWTDSVKLTARADSGLEIKSTGLSYSGYVYPSAGENLTVTFTVSGEGMTETKYTIVVKRAAKPEVYLEDMDISVGKLTPDFNKAETSYKLLLPINEKTVWFDLTASLGASISASGYDETDGGKFAVSVDPGKSQTIRFTVSKGTEAITYVVTVERKEGERITIKDSRNGKITVSDINAEYGDSVYIYVKPETGFALGELSITDSEGVSVKPVKVSENKYLFTMPKENVTIEAIFKIDLRMLPFGDVSLGSWYYDAIFYVYTNGLMEGVDSSSFNPDGTMTRAMIWAVLARIDGVSYITGSNWQTYARSWAMNNDISDGTNPNDPVTREQLVTMLWRFVGEPYSYGGLTGWSDASSVSDWAREAMSWAINDGIITGITSSTIGAKSTATRAQCATILMRFFEAID